jgi:SNF2 family DNA or RNA helicase
MTPKLSTALELICRFVAEGRAVLVFSALLPPLRTLSSALHGCGIVHHVLDGSVSPAERARKAAEFQGAGGPVPVLLAGQDCMSEGYNFPFCHRILSISSGWALDKCLQAEERGWRLDSAEDLHVYRLLTDDTIEGRMTTMLDEKTEGADAVLDAVWNLV